MIEKPGDENGPGKSMQIEYEITEEHHIFCKPKPYRERKTGEAMQRRTK